MKYFPSAGSFAMRYESAWAVFSPDARDRAIRHFLATVEAVADDRVDVRNYPLLVPKVDWNRRKLH